ncbi:MAG: hypothetical protein WCJ61_07260 [Paludibacter sp.]
MPNNSSRQNILQQIAAASKRRLAFVDTSVVATEEIYKAIEPDAVTCFKNELEAISGQIVLCESTDDLYLKLQELQKKRGFANRHRSFKCHR